VLSYRHAFHAGNHADVLKHLVLSLALDYLVRKDKPLSYIDTHAGAGDYLLPNGEPERPPEWHQGIQRLWSESLQRKGISPAISRYLQLIRAGNPGPILRRYPGSPLLAARILRPQDRIHCFEQQSRESQQLTRVLSEFRGYKEVRQQDGFTALRALLPPPSRRALVLLDPSYENKSDYQLVTRSLADALGRFDTGVYCIWYPMLARPEARRLPAAILQLSQRNWLHVQLQIKRPAPGGFGLYGSGMVVINPPWTLYGELNQALPTLTGFLAQDSHATFRIEQDDAPAMPNGTQHPHG